MFPTRMNAEIVEIDQKFSARPGLLSINRTFCLYISVIYKIKTIFSGHLLNFD